MRHDGRRPEELRATKITPNYLPTAEGSVLIEVGHTKVICAASLEETVPGFRRGSGKGWITAEYGMLPRSTSTRSPREVNRGRPGGRTHEIQRLIGRSLRGVTDLDKLGERTLMVDCDVIQADGGTRTASITGGWVALALALQQMVEFNMIGERTLMVDCDVIQADGGTRTASITGGWVALALALQQMVEFNMIPRLPLQHHLAATSVGVVDGVPMLDLCYEEDSQAAVDMNVVMTSGGEYVEVQATAEHSSFSRTQLDELLALADGGIQSLVDIQRQIVSL